MKRLLDFVMPYLLTLAIASPIAGFLFFRLRGPDVHWRSPSALILLLSLPLAAWTGFHADRRRRGALSYSRVSELKRIQQGWVSLLASLPRALRIVALALVVVALARPQRLSVDPTELEGIDIVIALDVSFSMQERDLLPDRITAAKRVIDAFIARRRSDRIGLVIFGKEAFTQCPLTLDYRALRAMLADVRLGLIDGQGTAIGNALGTALNRLRKSDAKSKVIILLTDGDNNAGNLSPTQSAKYAQSLGVKIFTILVGADAVAPGVDARGIFRGQVRYPVNPKLLEEIANETGGTPYLATDSVALEKRFTAILEDLDTSRLKDQTVSYVELYPLFLFPALGLILLEIALSLTRFRRFP